MELGFAARAEGRVRASTRIALAALGVLAALAFAAAAASAHESTTEDCEGPVGTHGCFLEVSEALDALEDHPDYDVVLATSDTETSNPTPFDRPVTVERSGISVCSADSTLTEPDEPRVVLARAGSTSAPGGGWCSDAQPSSTVIQPNPKRFDTETAVDIQASDVTFRGFTVRYDGDTSDGFTAVRLAGDDTTFEEGAVRIPGGCASAQEQRGCSGSPTVDGIAVEASDATVSDVTLTAEPVNREDPTTGVGSRGVTVASGATDAQVTDVRLEGWTVGVMTRGEDTTLTDSDAQVDFRGVQVAADGFEAHDNEIHATDAAVFVAGGLEDGDTVTLRGNDLDATSATALKVKPSLKDVTVDARANDWGVVGRDVIPQRFEGADDNTVHYMPYEDAQDQRHPPAPEILKTGTPKPEDCRATGAEDAEILTLQDAVDAVRALDGCQIKLFEDPESYDGATVDKDVTIRAEPVPIRYGHSPQDAHIVATRTQPALEITGEDAEATIEGVRVSVRGTDATGILVDGADGVTLTEVTVAGIANPSIEGLVIRDATDVRLEGSALTGLAQGVLVDGSDAVEIEDNRFAVDKRAVQASESAELLVAQNAMVGQGPDPVLVPSSAVYLSEATTGWTVQGNVMENWGFAGVHVTSTADGGAIVDNTIRDTWRFGVYVGAASGITVEENDLERAGLNGINLERTHDVTVTDNQITLDTLPGADARDAHDVPDTAFLREPAEIPAAGLWVQGATAVSVTENLFSGDAKDGILVTDAPGEDGQQPDLEPIRHNEFVFLDATDEKKDCTDHVDDVDQRHPKNCPAVSIPNTMALRIGNDVTDVGGEDPSILDARLNDWGVYEWQLVEQRATDESGGIWIDQFPFLQPNGAHGLPLSPVS